MNTGFATTIWSVHFNVNKLFEDMGQLWLLIIKVGNKFAENYLQKYYRFFNAYTKYVTSTTTYINSISIAQIRP